MRFVCGVIDTGGGGHRHRRKSDPRLCLARRASSLLLGVVVAMAASGCSSASGGTDPPAAAEAGHPPDGLHPVAGYRAYGTCPQGCSGHVPLSLRRPLHLPKVHSGGPCPITRVRAAGSDFPIAVGRGPVYAGVVERHGRVPFVYPPPPSGSSAQFAGSRWSGFKVLWVSKPTYAGPLLIRGRRLDGSVAVGFEQGLVPLDELQLAPGQGAGAPPSAHGWRNWPSTARIRSPGCYGWQIDGTSFSETIVIRATAMHSR